MRERITVRVLLFDPDGQILLMKGRMSHTRNGPGAWFTVGGGAEPGETLEACALREVEEETGFSTVTLGPAVWRREGVGSLASGEMVIFKETYFVAHCVGGAPTRDGWEAHEHELVDDLRWWTLEDLAACVDTIYPPQMLDLLPDVAARRYPAEPLEITVAEAR